MPSIVEGLNKPSGLTIAEALGGEKGMPISEVVKEHGGGGGDDVVVHAGIDLEATGLCFMIHTSKGNSAHLYNIPDFPEDYRSQYGWVNYNKYIELANQRGQRPPFKAEIEDYYIALDGDLMTGPSYEDTFWYTIRYAFFPDGYVSFNPNGGTWTGARDQYQPYYIGEVVDEPPTGGFLTPPEGKELIGWADTPDALEPNIEFPFPAPDRSMELTLYAVYGDVS